MREKCNMFDGIEHLTLLAGKAWTYVFLVQALCRKSPKVLYRIHLP